MTDIALTVQSLSKTFRVQRQRAGAPADPRRQRLTRRHDRFLALREVSFDVARGETLGVVGPNGSGKSTLLKILAGVMTPESGHFEARGRVGALLELGAGFHPDLTGLENIYLSGTLLGLSTREVDRLLPQIIAFAELERFMDMPVRHFSSGMVARLGFAVATQLAPDIILMDETFAAGDARFQAKALGHIAALKARGHTMLLVSHSLEMMLHLADRVLWLDQGLVRREGPAAEVLAEYRHSRPLLLDAAGHLRGRLGPASLYDAPWPEEPPVRIAEARLRSAAGVSTAEAGGVIDIQVGEPVRLELALEHPGAHPAQLRVETGWVWPDDRILAQSCTTVALADGGTRTRLTLRFDHWPLTESTWRCVVALSPLPAPHAAALAEWIEPTRYYDRTLDAGAVRVVTPNANELPLPIAIPARWEV